MVGEWGGGGGVVFFKETGTTEIYAVSLHDALPICLGPMMKPRYSAKGWLEKAAHPGVFLRRYSLMRAVASSSSVMPSGMMTHFLGLSAKPEIFSKRLKADSI